MSFALPAALALLALIPLGPLLKRRWEAAVTLPRAAELPRASLIARLPDLLSVVTLVALVLALAGPSTAGAVIEETAEGVPIVLAVDISSSMLARDFEPRDRLTVAKSTIARFIEARPADPIGVVAFAAEALTLVPATTHRALAVDAVQSLAVGLLEDGTAIGDGLATAVNRLRGFERNGVVVLLSDGESNRGTVDPLAAAEAAAALGVQVFTIGVGSDGVARVPVATAPAGFRYAELPVGVDEELLREIADRTGGAYFRATDAAALDRIYADIDRRVPSVVESTRYIERRSWAGLLLLVAGAFLVVEWAIRGSSRGPLP